MRNCFPLTSRHSKARTALTWPPPWPGTSWTLSISTAVSSVLAASIPPLHARAVVPSD